MDSSHYFRFGVGAFIIFLLGAWCGYQGRIMYARSLPSTIVQVRENSSEYHLINPLLYIDVPRKAPELNGLTKIISKYINDAKSQNLATSVSVYFRDMNTGKWSGVNEDEKYKPSSMLKILVMMVYYAKAEQDPTILDKKFYYQSVIDAGQHYQPIHQLKTGYYTAKELIHAMIVESDNVAAKILNDSTAADYIGLFHTLQLPYPESDATIDFMSPKSFAVILRTLYSGTYLSHDVSEKALELFHLKQPKPSLETKPSHQKIL